MFDLATRPQPATEAAAVFGVPFDWRLATPSAPVGMPWTDYTDPAGPAAHVEMLAGYSLELEDTLQTAVVLSLFSDRRAGPDDRLPLNSTDRRGWVGEEFMAPTTGGSTDAWGSGLWLLYASKVDDEVLADAQFAAQEALAWMVRDEIVSRVDVTTAWVGSRMDRLAVRPTIYRPDQVRPVYDVLWGTSIRRWAERGLQ